MKRLITSFNVIRAACTLVLAASFFTGKATFIPQSFLATHSYNCDVVVDGPAPFPPTTTWANSSIDTPFAVYTGSATPQRYGLASTTVHPASGYPNVGGAITSTNAAFGNVPYNLAPSTFDNAMHLRGSSFDTLLFTNQTYIGDVYLLAASNTGSVDTGAPPFPAGTVTVTFLFTDGTFHPVTGVSIPHYNDYVAANRARTIGYRVNLTNQNASGSGIFGFTTKVNLFDVRVELPYTLYSKQIKGIRIQKTGGDQINIMAVTVDHNPCLPTTQMFNYNVATPQPPSPQLQITLTDTIKWRTVPGSAGFDLQLVAVHSPANPTVAVLPTPLPILPVAPVLTTTKGATDTMYMPTGLVPNTAYVLFVRSKCNTGPSPASVWNRVGFITPKCQAVNAAQLMSVTPTTRSLTFKWNKTGPSGVIQPPSPTHIKFEYILVAATVPGPTPPPTSGFTTPTPPNDTFFRFNNLRTCQPYTFFIRSYCTANAYSDWEKEEGIRTSCCPSAGTPQILIVSGQTTNVPGSVTVYWPGNKDSAVMGYEYVLQTGYGTAPTTGWTFTPDTFMSFTNLNPGQFYRFWVRSNCTDTFSNPALSRDIPNPFYFCDTPSRPRISNINIHGARIEWSPGSSPAPYPIQRHNVAVTRFANPPTSTVAGDSSIPGNLLPNTFNGFWRINDTIHLVANLSADTKYWVHVRTQCDSVFRPPLATPPVPTYNYSAWKTDTFRTPLTCKSPDTPTITNITPHTAHMEWNFFPGNIGYEYYIDQQPNDPTSPPASWPLINFNQVDPINLFSGTNYWFHIRSKCDAVNYSPWVNTPFTTPPLCNLVSPAPALQASPGNPGPTSAIFNWPSVPNATAYDVAVTTSTTPPAAPDATVSINTYTAMGLSPNTNYYFHLKANCSPNDVTAWANVPFKTLPPLSVHNLSSAVSVLVYPNPVNDNLTVDIQNNPKGTLQVIDMMGKVLFSTRTIGEKTTIDMSPYATGVYLIKYFVDNSNVQMIRVQKI